MWFVLTFVGAAFLEILVQVLGVGTPHDIENIFLTRCDTLLKIRNLVSPPSELVNCTAAWDAFKSAFAGKNSCDVSRDDYDDYITITSHGLTPDKVVLWSGRNMPSFVKDFTDYGKRYTSIGDTLPGYLVNGLIWCGNERGIDYVSCPGYGDCSGDPVQNFWQQLSAEMASKAIGEVRILLNGSAEKAYSETSILATVEIMNLKSSRVTKIWLTVLHSENGMSRERCGTGSIALLEASLRCLGLTYECMTLVMMEAVQADNNIPCSNLTVPCCWLS